MDSALNLSGFLSFLFLHLRCEAIKYDPQTNDKPKDLWLPRPPRKDSVPVTSLSIEMEEWA